MRILILLLLVFSSSKTFSDEVVGSQVDYTENSDLDDEDLLEFNTQEVASNKNNFKSRFNSLWATCGQGCKPVEPWFKGDKKHCDPKKTPKGSCHNSLQAVDIHTIKCGSTTISGKTAAGSARFSKIVNCMDNQGAVTLWKVPGHENHFHVNFPGCNKKVGCGKSRNACSEKHFVDGV